MNLQKLAEEELCKREPSRWFTNHFYLQDKTGDLSLLGNLKRAQRKLFALKHFIDQQTEELNRIIVYKSRRQGISTAEAADNLRETLQNGINTVVVAHTLDAAQTIFAIYRLGYDMLDLSKPKAKQQNVREMMFENWAGSIRVLTAGSPEASRSFTVQKLHLSEYAYYKDPRMPIAILQTVTKKKGTSVTIESTANSEDPLFHPRWQNAEENCDLYFHEDPKAPFGFRVEYKVKNYDEWNGYFPLFLSCLEDEDCHFPVNDEEAKRVMNTLDREEEVLVERYGAVPSFLKWRRMTIKGECNGDIQKFHQEYPCTPEEGFLASGRPRFDLTKLNEMKRFYLENGTRGFLRQNETWDRKLVYVRDVGAQVVRYREPNRNHIYVLSADPAEGIIPEGGKDPDELACHVLDITAGGEQVAVYGGHISEDEAAPRIAILARYYNDAYVVPEEVGGRGLHLIIRLSELYPQDHIYHRMDFMKGTARQNQQLGYRTHVGNRNILIDDLSKAIMDEALIIHHDKTLKQLRQFKLSDKGKYEAPPGEHDDWVMALALAVHGMMHYPERLKVTPQTLHHNIDDPDVRRLYQPLKKAAIGKIKGYY